MYVSSSISLSHYSFSRNDLDHLQRGIFSVPQVSELLERPEAVGEVEGSRLLVPLVGLAWCERLHLKELHTVRGQQGFGTREECPANAVTMELRQYGHHGDLGSISTVSDDRQQSHILLSE